MITPYGHALQIATTKTIVELKKELGIDKTQRGQSRFTKGRLARLWAQRFMKPFAIFEVNDWPSAHADFKRDNVEVVAAYPTPNGTTEVVAKDSKALRDWLDCEDYEADRTDHNNRIYYV
jgi:hypothetical protein